MTSGARVGEAIESVDEIGEAAAEAAAGDLVGGDAVGLHEVRVHQVVALIVEDDGDAHALALEDAGGGEDEAWSSLPRESRRSPRSTGFMHGGGGFLVSFFHGGVGRVTSCR